MNLKNKLMKLRSKKAHHPKTYNERSPKLVTSREEESQPKTGRYFGKKWYPQKNGK